MIYQRRTSVLGKYPKRNGKQCNFTVEEYDLHYLASLNDVNKLKNVLRLANLTGKGVGKNVNLQDEDFGGRSPLHVACSKGIESCSSCLLAYNCFIAEETLYRTYL